MSSQFYESVQQKFDKASDLLNLPPSLYGRLVRPERIIETHYPVPSKDGSPILMRGIRVQHSTLLGPAKGGVRAADQRAEYKHENSLPEFVEISDRDLSGGAKEECMALAQGMTWKGGLHGLPFGGGKGLVIPDYGAMRRRPDIFTWLESDRVFPYDFVVEETDYNWRQFTRRISPVIGPEIDILAPDVGTGSLEMGLIRDEFSRTKGYAVPGVVTGKPVSIGGSLGRFEATALGAFFQFIEFLKKNNIRQEDITCAIQGFGNAGMVLAKYLTHYGFQINAISDSRGGINNPRGLDVLKVIEAKQRYPKVGVRAYRSVVSRDHAQQTAYIKSEELLELSLTSLFLAALQDQITDYNAHNIKAKNVWELANGPTTVSGAIILNNRGIFVNPDILCNGGGLVVSYFEWVQNHEKLRWETEEVHRSLKKTMLKSFNDVCDISSQLNISTGDAAMALGVAHVAQTACDLKKVWEEWSPNEFPPVIRDKVINSWNPEVTMDVMNL